MYYNDKKRIKIVQVVNIGIDIDEALSEESENPVQNKVVAKALNKKQLFLDTHPIGSYYITEETESPIDLYGGGWLQIKDCFLWATGDTQSITYTENGENVTKSLTLGATGGEFAHQTTVNEMPNHNHAMPFASSDAGNSNYARMAYQSEIFRGVTATTGGNLPHNNMPPYKAIYVWKRIS